LLRDCRWLCINYLSNLFGTPAAAKKKRRFRDLSDGPSPICDGVGRQISPTECVEFNTNHEDFRHFRQPVGHTPKRNYQRKFKPSLKIKSIKLPPSIKRIRDLPCRYSISQFSTQPLKRKFISRGGTA
jgi:hypothetical protein